MSATTILTSAARTVSGTADVTALASLGTYKAAIFLLDVTAAATDVADTLDVYVQSSIDSGTTYDDFVHFTQVLGNGGVKKYIATWFRNYTPTGAMHAPQDGAMAAGVNQGPIGDSWKIKWTVVDANSNASFTFSVKCLPITDKG